MKARKRWQYYCEFCKKSGGDKASMIYHESRCFKNPNRVCTLCKKVSPEPDKLKEQVNHIEENYWTDKDGTIKTVEENMDHCPACTLAAIMQADLIETICVESLDGEAKELDRKAFVEYPYKEKLKEWLNEEFNRNEHPY